MTPVELSRDDWLGERLGKPAWHLAASTDPAAGRRAATAPAFLDGRAEIADVARSAAFIAAGFTLVDTAVTLDRRSDLPWQQATPRVRPAAAEDADAVADIAARSFVSDRWHADAAIPSEVADRIKSDWASGFFAGTRGDWMVVAEHEGAVAGFLLLLDRAGEVVIDLIAVAASARRSGLAAAMIAHAAATCQPGVAMRVGTQLANIASLRLYESLGFRIAGAQHVFHCHVD